MKRENAGSWNSGLEKEQILETYSAQLQKSWNSTEYLIINNEKSSPKMKTRGPIPCPWGWAQPPLGVPPYLVGPLVALRRQLQLHILYFGEKNNQREGFIVFYDTEPPASPKLSREGWSGVRSGLRRGESVAIVIINHPPSPISWCSPPCVSNSIVGLLDGDGLDEIYHVIKLVLLGFDP